MPKIAKLLAQSLLGTTAALGLATAAEVGDLPPPDMVLVPAGPFVMGADDGLYDEAPAHRVYLDAYYIDRHEVTVAEFAAHVRAVGSWDETEGDWFRYSVEGCIDLLRHYEQRYGLPYAQAVAADEASGGTESVQWARDTLRWRAGVAALRELIGLDHPWHADASIEDLVPDPTARALIEAQASLPVRSVSWRDAAGYAAWAGKRLPTEAEWEKAARGTDAQVYPWGHDYGEGLAHAGLAWSVGPSPVGSHPQSAGPYGCEDMAGNVWEWCADWYGPASYTQTPRDRNPQGHEGLADGRIAGPDAAAPLFQQNQQGRETNTRKVVRGGCWADGAPGQTAFNLRASRRLWANPGYWQPDTGFRCVKDLP
ncbi:formylglycine-generating enzyme family protein [Actomonas aquatica]|uniref:SUMF1/EgtB/PvdO family nonheme iron enzyme n=1 Tax=Actomonas aquatica TaxID=2866162 RepID=A0ABZ1CFZ2_9BACT|nr:SUMF1/EgtB/PvdO family nonheme iron enzyme [Opitutus sp. WL0086]WRQ89205.1 SUMF1/EgtB/PvdO family nonheme iron enzyme [Opitutus sp. WL0086]